MGAIIWGDKGKTKKDSVSSVKLSRFTLNEIIDIIKRNTKSVNDLGSLLYKYSKILDIYKDSVEIYCIPSDARIDREINTLYLMGSKYVYKIYMYTYMSTISCVIDYLFEISNVFNYNCKPPVFINKEPVTPQMPLIKLVKVFDQTILVDNDSNEAVLYIDSDIDFLNKEELDIVEVYKILGKWGDNLW